ncbi:MAG: hypothetical protein RXO24_06060 [Acidilobus sp.]
MKIKDCTSRVSSAISQGKLPGAFKGFEEDLCEGAVRGLDVDQLGGLDKWIDWLNWSSVVLDENDYLKVALHALRLAPTLRGTDYGTARQRDLGQLWTDAIRGFLGEIAFAKWLREKYGLAVELDYSRGSLEEHLPSDIKSVNGRQPGIKISIKTTKLNGIWLDVPGAQIEHSDVYVLVRVGVTREHLIAFFKKISVIRDKLMQIARERGLLSEEELREIWNAVPDFSPLPAYVAGFLDKSEISEHIKNEHSIIEADGTVKVSKIVINKYMGYWHSGEDIYAKNLREYLKRKGKSIKDNMKIEFEGIGEFSRAPHFIASSGLLKKRKEDWDSIVARL